MFTRLASWLERAMAPSLQILAELPPAALRAALYRL